MDGSDTDGSKSPVRDNPLSKSLKRTKKKSIASHNANVKRAKSTALLIKGCWCECGVQDVWVIDFNLD